MKMTNEQIREAFKRKFWLHRVPKNTKQMNDILNFFLSLRSTEMKEVEERIRNMKVILWSDDPTQHIRNIQNNETIEKVLTLLSHLSDNTEIKK